MKRAGALLLGFGYMVLLIQAIHLGVSWWHGETEDFGLGEWLTLASLPVLGWIWWRYLSPFAPGRGQCLLPPEDKKPPDR